MRRLFFIAAALLVPVASSAGVVSGGGASGPTGAPRVLWDSGVVPDSVSTVSSALDLSAVRELEIFVDNTSGTGFRDLALLPFAPDGVTTMDSFLLAKVPWGLKASGATHDPGRARVYVGPNPAGPGAFDATVLDTTSGTNAALDVTLFTESCDQLFVSAIPSAGTTQLQTYIVDDAGVATRRVAAGSANSGTGIVWALGAADLSAGGIGTANYKAGEHPPRRAQLTTTAAGVGNTVRLRVGCWGRIPGTFAHQMTLPPRAKVQLGSATGTARFWVVGR